MKRSTRLRRHRSASLQLSINAIVILVMAMVVLGLGLSFVRNLFGKGTDNLGKVLDNSELENPADSETPLTVDKTVKVRATKSTTFSVGFYNGDGKDVKASPSGAKAGTHLIECFDENGLISVFRLSSPLAGVTASEAKGFSVSLKPVHGNALDALDLDLNAKYVAGSLEESTVEGPNQEIRVPAGTYICTLEMYTEYDDGTGTFVPGDSTTTQFTVEVSG